VEFKIWFISISGQISASVRPVPKGKH